MADSVPYPGSPSLSPEAREKVLQTFHHTIDLARGGKNEEALLGCDFILKMDPRFTPAKKLLESLRGASAGTILDLSPVEAFLRQVAPAPPPVAPPVAPPAPADPFGSLAPAETASRLAQTADPFDFGGAPDPFGSFSPSGPFAAVILPDQGAAKAAPTAPALPTAPKVPAAPTVPAAPRTPAPQPPNLGGGLDDLSFDQALDFDLPPSAPKASPFGAPPPRGGGPSLSAGLPPADPFATPAEGFHTPFSQAPAAAPPQSATDLFGTGDPFASPGAGPFATSPSSDPFATSPSADPFAASPSSDPFAASPSSDPFAASPSSDPFAAQPPSSFSSSAPDPFAQDQAPETGFEIPAAEPAFPYLSSPPPVAPGAVIAMGSVATTDADPRISQFLKQGDEAMARGQVQEAIDLWSRVFLIDLSNDDASLRIDAARDKQTQMAQAIDVLVSEGIALFDRADLISARSKFLDVLAIQEGEATARSYLNQIEAVLSQQQAPGEVAFREPSEAVLVRDRSGQPFEASPRSPSTQASTGAAETSGASAQDVDREGRSGANEPSLSDGELERLTAGPAKGRGGVKLDARILLAAAALILVAIGAGAYFLLRGRSTTPPPPPVAAKPGKPAPAGDPLEKARTLFELGKPDEALQILVAVREGDPRHADALALIDRIKSSAAPTPPTPPPSAAALDELRVQGLAAVRSSRYIEGVKALDPVVKARPDDQDAAQALAKAREQLAALSSAIRAFNEGDFESATKLLWELRKKDARNADVEEYLFKSYYNDGVAALQSGNTKRASQAFSEAAQLRPSDTEAQRHVKFLRRYPSGPTDLLSRIYVKHTGPRT